MERAKERLEDELAEAAKIESSGKDFHTLTAEETIQVFWSEYIKDIKSYPLWTIQERNKAKNAFAEGIMAGIDLAKWQSENKIESTSIPLVPTASGSTSGDSATS